MKLKLHTQIFLAILSGVACGLFLGEYTSWIAPVGQVFIRLLRMMILPLILGSIITGMIGIGGGSRLGRVGLRTFVYYFATTFLAVSLGLLLVNVIRPGEGAVLGQASSELLGFQRDVPAIGKILLEIIPSNVVASMASGNILPVIFFSIILGVTLAGMPEKGKPLADCFRSLEAVMMRLAAGMMRLAPIGIFALMADLVGRTGLEVFRSLALYMTTVVVGLGIHAFLTIPILIVIAGRRSPLKLFRAIFPALATAFSTASSAATLPITMDCLEEEAGVSEEVTSFVLPLGATINMDGTALYEAVAAMFIAQAYGLALGFGEQVVIVLTATLASIGAAAIPGAGLVTMVIVLQAVNLPVEGIAMILAVDWLLDMLRTTVNVWGDASGAAIINRYCPSSSH